MILRSAFLSAVTLIGLGAGAVLAQEAAAPAAPAA